METLTQNKPIVKLNDQLTFPPERGEVQPVQAKPEVKKFVASFTFEERVNLMRGEDEEGID